LKITYLHQYFNTPSMPGGTRSYEMAKRLVAMGHEVNMVTSWREAESRRQWFETNEAGIIEDLQLLNASDSKPCPDTFSLQLRFADGSIGSVHYFANGSKAFPKERLEVFAAGKVLRLDNYRKLQAWGLPGFRTRRRFSQDKGQQACCAAFLAANEAGGPAPIPAVELFEVQRWLLQAVGRA
jgi:predicted dehydrogenase